MGRGSYTSQDWANLSKERNINTDSTVSQLYHSRNMQEVYNPYGVKYRESCDSEDSPESTAIIFGLDVTGSMGYLSEEIAKTVLNRTMLEIYDKKPVTNPHIMFNAIGDAQCDRAPLQVTQFEADIRIAEQLLDIWFEGAGGSNGGESYLLTWYFAAKHTKIDCFDKRSKKGFIFTMGDECCHKILTREEIKRVFGDTVDHDYTAAELFNEASRMYEIFHIVIKTGGYNYQQSGEDWKKLIDSRVIEFAPNDLDKLPELFVSLMQTAGGMDISKVSEQWNSDTSTVVQDAISRMRK
jgi:hypothetical protein